MKHVVISLITKYMIHRQILEYSPTYAHEKKWFYSGLAVGGDIYAFGGEGIGESYDSVERYDPENDIWRYELPLPTERMGLKAVQLTDKIYVLGGQIINNGAGLIPLKVNEVFHINKSSTETINENEGYSKP